MIHSDVGGHTVGTGPYEVAIPTYRRAETLARKTLPMLAEGGVPRELVTVFVADRDDGFDVAKHADAEHYARIVDLNYDPKDEGQIGLGPYGLGVARNLIARWYPIGTRLVQVDDDLRGLLMWAGQKDDINAQVETLSNVDMVLQEGFRLAEAEGVGLWGIHPARTYMRNEVKVGLYYIGGGLFGFTVRGDDAELVTLDDKEDYERTLRFFMRDGAVVRIDWATWATTGYGGAGGMQETRTPERILRSAEWLVARYPELCTLNLTKKSGKPEVRLRRF